MKKIADVLLEETTILNEEVRLSLQRFSDRTGLSVRGIEIMTLCDAFGGCSYTVNCKTFLQEK